MPGQRRGRRELPGASAYGKRGAFFCFVCLFLSQLYLSPVSFTSLHLTLTLRGRGEQTMEATASIRRLRARVDSSTHVAPDLSGYNLVRF